MEWSKVIPYSGDKAKNAGYIVRHKYRAANGFGAKIIVNQLFSLSTDGTVVSVMKAD